MGVLAPNAHSLAVEVPISQRTFTGSRVLAPNAHSLAVGVPVPNKHSLAVGYQPPTNIHWQWRYQYPQCTFTGSGVLAPNAHSLAVGVPVPQQTFTGSGDTNIPNKHSRAVGYWPPTDIHWRWGYQSPNKNLGVSEMKNSKILSQTITCEDGIMGHHS